MCLPMGKSYEIGERTILLVVKSNMRKYCLVVTILTKLSNVATSSGAPHMTERICKCKGSGSREAISPHAAVGGSIPVRSEQQAFIDEPSVGSHDRSASDSHRPQRIIDSGKTCHLFVRKNFTPGSADHVG